VSTRREFLETGAVTLGLTATLAPTVLRASASPASTTTRAIELYKVIADVELAPSLKFAEVASQLGLPVATSPSDITWLWYHDLQPRWTRSPAAVAGLTSAESLFCLERLAWDHSMRVLFKVVHTPKDNGTMEHEVHGPNGSARSLMRSYARNDCWVTQTAHAIAQFPGVSGPSARRTVIPTKLHGEDSLECPLVSWVIGPRLEGTAV
jgi:hypothetical protein